MCPIAVELLPSFEELKAECRSKLSLLVVRMWHKIVEAGTRPVNVSNKSDYANGLYVLYNFFEAHGFVSALRTRLNPNNARALAHRMLR